MKSILLNELKRRITEDWSDNKLFSSEIIFGLDIKGFDKKLSKNYEHDWRILANYEGEKEDKKKNEKANPRKYY